MTARCFCGMVSLHFSQFGAKIGALIPSSSFLSRTKSAFYPRNVNPRNLPLRSTKRGVFSLKTSPILDSGTMNAFMGYITGKSKATEVAHFVWQHIVQRGDTVIDATCGNGLDTLALLEMVSDESQKGCVYSIDIQQSALDSTLSLLNQSVDQVQRKQVKLFLLCHSRMRDIVPEEKSIRLIAFNLGYLPGGDKAITTTLLTTLEALQAASKILCCGGLISLIAYVGHPGGREEWEAVQLFISGLPTSAWVCSKFEVLNRPNSPVLVLLFKK